MNHSTLGHGDSGQAALPARTLTGLPKLAFGRWHPYRRLFVTELRSLPIRDVATAGGWNSTEMVQRIYQQAQASGVLSAVQPRRKRGRLRHTRDTMPEMREPRMAGRPCGALCCECPRRDSNARPTA